MRIALLLAALVATPAAAQTATLNGAMIGDQIFASPVLEAVHWDSQDGKVLKFVCQGILPR